MSSFIEEAFSSAKSRSAVSKGPRGSSVRPSSGLTMPRVVGSQELAAPPLNQSAMHARQQQQHLRGWVYASIKPIAIRIASQNVRVARMLKPGQEKSRTATKAILPKSLKHYDNAPGAEVLEGHEFVDAINDPNDVMVKWQLFYVTVISMKITGRGFWWIEERKPTKDNPRKYQIWHIPSGWMTPIHTEDKLFAFWRVLSPHTGAEDFIPGDQIVCFSYPDFTDPLGTFSPMQAADKAVVTDECMQEAQRRGFVNGVNPGWLLTVGRLPDAATGGPGMRPVLTDVQRAQLIHMIKAHYKGVVRWDEPMILDGLIEDARRATNTNLEMAYGESGKITKERICENFGTSPVVMGHLENANRASSMVADETFVNSTVNPDIELISEILTNRLGPRFAAPGEKLLLYIEPADTTDTTMELKQVLALYDRGGCDIDFLRAKLLGLPPTAGGNVAFIRPELVPYVLGGGDGSDNPYVVQFRDRPQQAAPKRPGQDNLVEGDIGGEGGDGGPSGDGE